MDASRANAIVRYDPQLAEHRARLARTVILLLYLLLAAWLAVDLAIAISSGTSRTQEFAFDALSIAAAAITAGICFWLVRRDQVPTAGYVLGVLFLVLTSAGILIYPEDIYLVNLGYVIAILVVGAINGGRTSYAYALMAFTLLTIGWFNARAALPDASDTFGQRTGLIFLGSSAIVYLGLAAGLHTLSDNIHRTIARLHSQTEQLTHLAHTDPLTGLANRRHLIEQLQREFTRARRYYRPLSLIYLDLDGFKAINDRFGHIFGDEILRGSALAMRAILRSADLLARIGGDEFAVLLPETSVDDSRQVAKKLRKALAAYSRHLGPLVPPLSFCAGVGQLRDDDESIDDLLARADEAVYRAKDAGKGQTRTQYEVDQLPLFAQSENPDTAPEG